MKSLKEPPGTAAGDRTQASEPRRGAAGRASWAPGPEELQAQQAQSAGPWPGPALGLHHCLLSASDRPSSSSWGRAPACATGQRSECCVLSCPSSPQGWAHNKHPGGPGDTVTLKNCLRGGGGGPNPDQETNGGPGRSSHCTAPARQLGLLRGFSTEMAEGHAPWRTAGRQSPPRCSAQPESATTDGTGCLGGCGQQKSPHCCWNTLLSGCSQH